MPTTNIMNSTVAVISLADVVIAELTGCSVTITHTPRNVTNKGSGGWKELLEGLREWNATAQFMYIPGASKGWKDVFLAYTSRSQLALEFGSPVAADQVYSGLCYFTTGTLDSPSTEDNVVCDVSFDGTGPLAESTNP